MKHAHPYSEKKTITCKDTGEVVTGNNYLETRHWKQMRELVYMDRNATCERCHNPISLKEATVHHVTYNRIGNEKLTDLKLLCNRCHLIVHKAKREGHQENKSIMSLYSRLSKSDKEKVMKYIQSLLDN